MAVIMYLFNLNKSGDRPNSAAEAHQTICTNSHK